MKRIQPNGLAVAAGIALAIVGLAVAAYKLKHPRCRHCDLELQAIDLAEKVVCPGCGQVLNGLQALLA